MLSRLLDSVYLLSRPDYSFQPGRNRWGPYRIVYKVTNETVPLKVRKSKQFRESLHLSRV